MVEGGQEALETILRDLSKEGIQPGDRRRFEAVACARAYAWVDEADRVEPEHLEILAHVLWDAPREQPEKVAQVIAKIANPVGMRVNQLLLECEQIVSAADTRNLAQAATATAKLGEIDRQLGTLRGSDRVERARVYVRAMIRTIKVASVEAI